MERKKNKSKAKQTKATSKPLRRTKKIKTPAESPDKNVLKAIKWTMENDPEIVSMRKTMNWYISSIHYPRADIVSLTDWELYHRISNETDWSSDNSLHVAFTFIERMMNNYLLPVDCVREHITVERDRKKRANIISKFLVSMGITASARTGKKAKRNPDEVRHFYLGQITGNTMPIWPSYKILITRHPDLPWEEMKNRRKALYYPDCPKISPADAVKKTAEHFGWGSEQKDFRACATFLVDKCKLRNIPRFAYESSKPPK